MTKKKNFNVDLEGEPVKDSSKTKKKENKKGGVNLSSIPPKYRKHYNKEGDK